MSGKGQTVAVVDRDSPFVSALAHHAVAAGVRLWCNEGPIELSAVIAMRLDAMVLDPDTCGEGGWSYLEQLCEEVPDVGVLVCTGRTSLERRVRGLRLGVDDWLTKPAHPAEAIARAEAVSRPRRVRAADGPIEIGDLRLDEKDRRAYVRGRELELSRQEFDLLSTFVRTTGEVLDRETIYQRAWGFSMADGDRSVDVFVARLRAKLAAHRAGHTYIHTHFRIGYRFEPAC